MRVGTDVPDQTPASTVAAWPAQGPVMRRDDGVGEPGLEVDGCSIAGHTDLLQAANAQVIGSMRMDPVAQAITSGDHACGTDFNLNPVSPLLDRGAPINLSCVGWR